MKASAQTFDCISTRHVPPRYLRVTRRSVAVLEVGVGPNTPVVTRYPASCVRPETNAPFFSRAYRYMCFVHGRAQMCMDMHAHANTYVHIATCNNVVITYLFLQYVLPLSHLVSAISQTQLQVLAAAARI